MGKLKIFDYCWHTPHQWDMVNALHDDCEFYYCLNVKRHWNTAQRPVPSGLKFVTHYEQELYDAAILHIDQQMVNTFHQKHLIYKQFDSTIAGIPKIVINHGAPVYPEYFQRLGLQLSEAEMQEKCVDIIRNMVGGHTMVVNSHTSATQKEWGFGHPIVHGMNPAEWLDLPKEPRVFTALSPVGLDMYYNRKCMAQVADELYDTYGYILHYAKINADVGSSPEAYKAYLGKSLLYLDTSFRTPMNRARTEAFLSGCCVIQVEGAHDLERWAKPDENIIIVPNSAKEIARVVADLLENGYDRALTIGQKGKKMATVEFSYDRYRSDWLKLLQQVVRKHKS
jgi:glycosyltransferase involved in cell wall biosynthesis